MTQGKLMIEKMIFSDDSRSSMVKKIHGYHSNFDYQYLPQLKGAEHLSCIGICNTLRSSNGHKVSTRDGKGRYDQDQRWCGVCEFFIHMVAKTSNSCPCCGSKLRSRPRSMKFKKKFRNRISNSNSLLTIITSGTNMYSSHS